MLLWALSDRVACSYPLNASRATVQGYGFTDVLALSNGSQSTTYLIVGGLVSPNSYAAIQSVLGQVTANSGLKAMEWSIDHAPTFSGGTGATNANHSLVFYTGAMAAHLTIQINYRDNGTKDVAITLAGSSVYAAATTATRFGVLFDAANSRVHIQDNTGEIVLSSNTYTPQTLTPAVQVVEAGGLSGTYAGQVIGSTFISDASNFSYGYGAGSTDLCGTAAAESYILTELSVALATESGSLITVE